MHCVKLSKKDNRLKRKLIVIPAVIFLSFLTVWFAARLFLISLVSKELRKIFPESRVSIRDAGINLQGVYLRSAGIFINSSKPVLPELLKYAKQGSSRSIPPLIKVLKIENLNLKVESPDLGIAGALSAQVGLQNRSLNYCRLEVDSLRVQGFELKKLFLDAKLGKEGSFSIEQISYNKGKINDIKSRAWLRKEDLFLDSLSFRIFDGGARGDLTLKTGGTGEYISHLKFTGLDLGAFVRDFELEKKFLLDGKVNGDIALEGKGASFRILSGKFSTLEPGGELNVTDARFLENLASRSGESLNILIEGFKDYHYNTAMINFTLDNGDLTFAIDLEGKEGKRNLTVVVHDFKLGRGDL